MNKAVLGGLIIVCAVIIVIAGFYVFNLPNSNTSTVKNTMTTTVNQTGNSATNNNFPSTTLSTFISYSESYNDPSKPTPSPQPGPNPDPMDHIIGLFDTYIKSNYDQSLIPAIAVVIVQNDAIIYMNTLGVKDLASGEPVDENTLFGIGSCTKAFTATNIAQLVSKGLISWDDPIAKYYPDPHEFQLYSDYVTNNITIRDALSHRSGLPAYSGDIEWAMFNNSYPYILYQLRYMENDTSFRSTFEYNNLIYALASYCAAREANTTWNELMEKDLLDPLGMTTSVASYPDFLNTPNHVTPYKLLQNGTMMPYDIIPDFVGPAGSIYSSISEMVNWLKFQINDTGYYNGVQIVSKKELDETRTPQIKTGPGAWYGLGWGIEEEYIHHAGATNAFRSQVTVYPSNGLGIVILSNGGQYANAFKTCLDTKFRELLRGNEAYDPWPDAQKQAEESWKPVPPTPPILNQTLSLNGYVGVYSNNFYGNIDITTNNNTLICYYGNNSYPFELKHWNNNTFEDPINNGHYNFTDISNGKANKLTIDLSDFPLTPSTDAATFNRTK